MKKLTLLLALSILFSITSIASRFQNRSILEFKLWDNSRFSVEIDNKTYPSKVRHFRVENLRAGDHYIKVIKRTQRPNGFISQVIFKGKVRIKARSIITAKITRHRVFDIIRIRPLHRSHSNHGVNSHHGHHGSYGVNSHGSVGVNSHSYTSEHDFVEVMSMHHFSILKETIKRSSFDSKRIEIAKYAVMDNMFRSTQILELMELLSFESHRLELAKFAYRSTVDTENYFTVNSAFSFGSSITALYHYINTIPV